MVYIALSDLGRSFTSRQTNISIRETIAQKTHEVSTGDASDIPLQAAGAHGRWASISSRIEMIGHYQNTASTMAAKLDAGQSVLGEIEAMRSTLAGQFLMERQNLQSEIETAITLARGGFERTVQLLNTPYGGRSLFGGEATQLAPLQTGAQMLSAIKSYLAALPTGADADAALEAWFNDPALPDGFLNWGYQGTAEAGAQQIDHGQEIAFNLQANHPVFRDLLQSYAKILLSEDLGMSGEAQLKAIKASGMEALSLAEDFVGLQSRVGVLQSEVETAQTRLAAEKTALGLEERKIAQADSFEAATLLQSASDQLELHYTLTNKLSKLSLVNYL